MANTSVHTYEYLKVSRMCVHIICNRLHYLNEYGSSTNLLMSYVISFPSLGFQEVNISNGLTLDMVVAGYRDDECLLRNTRISLFVETGCTLSMTSCKIMCGHLTDMW